MLTGTEVPVILLLGATRGGSRGTEVWSSSAPESFPSEIESIEPSL